MRLFQLLFAFTISLLVIHSNTQILRAQDMTQAAKEFVAEHERKIEPLEIEIGKAWWNANVTGKDEDFAKKEESENRLNDSLADTKQFDRLKKIHDGQIGDGTLKQEMDLLNVQYYGKRFVRRP